jgi:hypothetical protein
MSKRKRPTARPEIALPDALRFQLEAAICGHPRPGLMLGAIKRACLDIGAAEVRRRSA